MDLILIPSQLHIDPLRFQEYPPALQRKIRSLLPSYIRAGWGGNTDMVKRDA